MCSASWNVQQSDSLLSRKPKTFDKQIKWWEAPCATCCTCEMWNGEHLDSVVVSIFRYGHVLGAATHYRKAHKSLTARDQIHGFAMCFLFYLFV
jgi:hypothetical protein